MATNTLTRTQLREKKLLEDLEEKIYNCDLFSNETPSKIYVYSIFSGNHGLIAIAFFETTNRYAILVDEETRKNSTGEIFKPFLESISRDYPNIIVFSSKDLSMITDALNSSKIKFKALSIELWNRNNRS